MDAIYVNVKVSNPANLDVGESVRALVNASLMLSVMPADVLERLGILRMQSRRFQRFGGAIARDIGIVNMRFKDAEGGVTVIFAEDEDTPTMGATALTTLGFEVDPASGRLNSVDMRV